MDYSTRHAFGIRKPYNKKTVSSHAEYLDTPGRMVCTMEYTADSEALLGSAGAGFILGRLYQALREEKYLEAAKKVDIYLDTLKVSQEKGFLLPYRVGDPGETIFYLGNCHGAAGTAAALLRIYMAETGIVNPNSLADDPFKKNHSVAERKK